MLEDVRAGKPDLWEEARVGVRAADDYTLEMELRSAMPQLPLLLLHCTWFPIPRHAVEAHGGMLDRTGKWTRPGEEGSHDCRARPKRGCLFLSECC